MNNETFIQVKDISKYYEDGKVIALDGVNMSANKGEFLVITGPSGSGKSTLLHLLGGLDAPSKGEILFEGRKLKDVFKQSQFRIHNIGFVFQAFYLWPTLNVLENVLLPLMESQLKKNEQIERAKELISVVGLGNRFTSSVTGLSMGERQRVAIARALAMNPMLLLADEPTGSLDSKNTENILQLFKNINKERSVTIVMVTHERMEEGFFDRTIRLLDGKVQ